MSLIPHLLNLANLPWSDQYARVQLRHYDGYWIDADGDLLAITHLGGILHRTTTIYAYSRYDSSMPFH
eukprot:scaffold2367_cov269-Chaetoceros_neogracile.AAC.4